MQHAWAWGFLLLAFFVSSAPSWGKGTYLEPEQFLFQTFGGQVPKPEVLWLNAEHKKTIAKILQTPYRGLRQRYWKSATRSAWILQHIGKEQPITAGIVIIEGRIDSVQVLVFRESRGWEIKHEFFTRQFARATLQDDLSLNQSIDGISGATLSVRAMKNMARLALYLDTLTTP